jgi:hypothetical protein
MSDEYNCPPVCQKCGRCHRGNCLPNEQSSLAAMPGYAATWTKQKSFTVKDQCGPVAQDVHKLEQQCKKLSELCGQILATLKVNRLRCTLTSADDKQLDAMIEAWSADYWRYNDQIQPPRK